MLKEKPQTIDEYLSAVKPAFRAELERIRALVTGIVPDVEETVSYSMPTLKYQNRALIYFTASKNHMSFYPSSWAIDEYREDLKDYTTTTHAIQFTPDRPLSAGLIERLVRFHMLQIDAGRQ